jgi:hypothetical protein
MVHEQVDRAQALIFILGSKSASEDFVQSVLNGRRDQDGVMLKDSLLKAVI